jgi:hypothetical protein
LQARNDRIFEKASSMLSGANGIVYLLFVGRENYAANIQGLMTGALFADKSNVNQVMAKLTVGKTFLVYKGKFREKGARGRARQIYSANLSPITATLNKLEIGFDEQELSKTLVVLSDISNYFPKYLTNIFETFLIRRLTWHQILASYITYLSLIIRYSDLMVYPMPSELHLSKEVKEGVLQSYPLIVQHLESIAFQLHSPSIGINPQYKAHLDKITDELASRESQTTKFLTLLRELEKEGITDFSALLSIVREVIAIYQKRDELLKRLDELSKEVAAAESKVNEKSKTPADKKSCN